MSLLTAEADPGTDAPDPVVDRPERSRSNALTGRWPLAGLVAGVLGTFTTYVTSPMLDEEVKAAGVEAVVAELEDQRTLVHLGSVTGFAAMFALIVFAVGFSRWLGERTRADSMIAPAAKLAFAGAIGALTVAYSFQAMLAGGIPGGVDEGLYTTTDVSVLHLLVDQFHWAAWMGVAVVMALTAVVSLRDRLLARWIGVVSALAATMVGIFTLVLGLPYSAGVTAPPWLALVTVAVLLQRRRERQNA